MNSESTNGNGMLVRRTKTYCFFLLGFLLLFGWFSIRLATTESADDWKENNITIADVQHISQKPNHWSIADTDGNRYSVYDSQEVMSNIFPNSTYHIFYSANGNEIRAMANDDSVVVDYEHSVSVHCERNIWDWLMTFLGVVSQLEIPLDRSPSSYKKSEGFETLAYILPT